MPLMLPLTGGLIAWVASAMACRSNAATDAQVAQLVEHATENRSVGGSIPPLGTIAAMPLPPLLRAIRFLPRPACATVRTCATQPVAHRTGQEA